MDFGVKTAELSTNATRITRALLNARFCQFDPGGTLIRPSTAPTTMELCAIYFPSGPRPVGQGLAISAACHGLDNSGERLASLSIASAPPRTAGKSSRKEGRSGTQFSGHLILCVAESDRHTHARLCSTNLTGKKSAMASIGIRGQNTCKPASQRGIRLSHCVRLIRLRSFYYRIPSSDMARSTCRSTRSACTGDSARQFSIHSNPI